MSLAALLAHKTQSLALNRDILTADCPRLLCLEGQRPCWQIFTQSQGLLSRVGFFFTLLMEGSPIEANEVALCATGPPIASSMEPGPFHILPEFV